MEGKIRSSQATLFKNWIKLSLPFFNVHCLIVSPARWSVVTAGVAEPSLRSGVKQLVNSQGLSLNGLFLMIAQLSFARQGLWVCPERRRAHKTLNGELFD